MYIILFCVFSLKKVSKMVHLPFKFTVLLTLFYFCGFSLNTSECLRIAISENIRNFSANSNSSNSSSHNIYNNSSKIVTYIQSECTKNSSDSSTCTASIIYHKSLNLTCEAEEPLEWIYEGGGSPSKVIEYARREGGRIISQLLFETGEKSREYSQHTGNYLCRALNNPSRNASVYIYFPGNGAKVFVGEESKEEDLPEILYLSECLEAESSQLKSANPNLDLEIEQEIEGENKRESRGCPKLIIPCLTTTPNVNVSLFRKTFQGMLEPLNVLYDSKVGFTLDLDPQFALPSYYYSMAGEYVCVASFDRIATPTKTTSPSPSSSSSSSSPPLVAATGRGLKSKSKSKTKTKSSPSTQKGGLEGETLSRNLTVTKIFYVYPPKTIKATPVDSIVYIGQVLNFTCESNLEPVVIKETEFHVPSYFDSGEEPQVQEDEEEADIPEVEETTETVPNSQHVANYIDTNPIVGSYGEFQCLSESSKASEAPKIHHTWKYFVIGKEADEKSGIRYSKRKKSFSCRSKANQPGHLSYIHCETPSECKINLKCLQNSNSCRGYKSPLGQPSNRCKMSKSCTELLHFGSSGYIRCSGELIEEIKKFNETGLESNEPLNLHLNLNDLDFLHLKSNSNFDIHLHTPTLQLTNYSLTNAADNESMQVLTIQVRLKRSRFHFIDGQTWAVQFGTGQKNLTESGKIEDEGKAQVIPIQPDSASLSSKDESEYEFKIPLTGAFHGRNPVQVLCKVPMRNSMDWKTISIFLPNMPALTENISRKSERNSTESTSENEEEVRLPVLDRTDSSESERQNGTESDIFETTTTVVEVSSS